MNIYLIIEDGDTSCIKGRTMAEAINVCESIYLEDRAEEEKGNYNQEHESEYYHEQILQSCTLVGHLKN